MHKLRSIIIIIDGKQRDELEIQSWGKITHQNMIIFLVLYHNLGFEGWKTQLIMRFTFNKGRVEYY